MVIGPTFAYGHIAKTGGDAVHQWFAALQRPNIVVDDVNLPSKHERFGDRPAAAGKQHYLVGLRRLPNWTLSLLHELAIQETHWPTYGWKSAADALNPANALKRPFADQVLGGMIRGVKVTHWLRMEYLFEDFLAFVQNNLQLTAEESSRVRAVQTKPPRPYERDVTKWWSVQEITQIYALNPTWAALEKAAYPL